MAQNFRLIPEQIIVHLNSFFEKKCFGFFFEIFFLRDFFFEIFFHANAVLKGLGVEK